MAVMNITPEEYFSELGRLQREFPELSKAALIETMRIMYEEDDDEL